MKKSFLIICVLISISFQSFASDLPSLLVSVETADSALLSGDQMDYLSQSLYPEPNQFSSEGININIKYFVSPNIGVESSFTVFNSLKSLNTDQYIGITAYDLKTLELGGTFRFTPSDNRNVYTTWLLSAGITYSMIDYADEYSDLLLEYFDYLYPIKPELGWYSKVGFQTNIGKYFFVGIAAKVYFLNNMIEESNNNFDGLYWNMPLYIGLSY